MVRVFTLATGIHQEIGENKGDDYLFVVKWVFTDWLLSLFFVCMKSCLSQNEIFFTYLSLQTHTYINISSYTATTIPQGSITILCLYLWSLVDNTPINRYLPSTYLSGKILWFLNFSPKWKRTAVAMMKITSAAISGMQKTILILHQQIFW